MDKLSWIDVRDLVQKAKFKKFQCSIDYYKFIDLSDEELRSIKKEVEAFLADAPQSEYERRQTARKRAPGFYLVRDFEYIAGPFSSFKEAATVRARLSSPELPPARTDEWEWSRGNGGPTGYERMKALKRMNALQIIEIKGGRNVKSNTVHDSDSKRRLLPDNNR